MQKILNCMVAHIFQIQAARSFFIKAIFNSAMPVFMNFGTFCNGLLAVFDFVVHSSGEARIYSVLGFHCIYY